MVAEGKDLFSENRDKGTRCFSRKGFSLWEIYLREGVTGVSERGWVQMLNFCFGFMLELMMTFDSGFGYEAISGDDTFSEWYFGIEF